MAENKLLEISPYESDGGELIGKDPKKVGKEILMGLEGPKNYPQAIRSKCLDCCGYNSSEVRKCTATSCPLWAFRMGRNPFHGRAK